MNKPGYKHTDLGWIPEDWDVKKIKDIGKISSGTTPLRSTAEYHSNGDIYWVKTTDLNNSVITDTEEKVTKKALIETSLRMYPKGTLLVAMYGGFNQIGRTGLLGIEATINQALTAITVDTKQIDQTFLLNWLNANVALWKSFAGSSRKDPNITSNDVGDFPVIDIPLPEQRRIAAILSTWDAAIAKEQKLIDALQTRHRALMQQLLSGKKRLKGFKVEWKEFKLRQVISRMTNGITYNPENTEGLPVTRIETISSGNINFNKVGFADKFDNQEKYRLQYGDILFSHINSLAHIGKVAMYLDGRPLYHGMNLLLLRVNTNADRDFIYNWLNSETAKKLNQSLAKPAVNQASISTFELKEIRLKLPPLEEQTAIAAILTTSEKEIQTHRRHLAALQQQKKGLMQVLLTGKVRVKPTET